MTERLPVQDRNGEAVGEAQLSEAAQEAVERAVETGRGGVSLTPVWRNVAGLVRPKLVGWDLVFEEAHAALPHAVCADCGGTVVPGLEGWDHVTRFGHVAHYARPAETP